MSEEDREILARISQLAGQINRRKNQYNNTSSHAPHRYSPYHGRGSPAYRATRGGAAPHRHRTLVLNGNSGSQTPTAATSAPAAGGASTATSPDGPSSSTSASWVQRTDRHMQLINSNVYERESQTRTKAIEETRQRKLRERDAREKNKLLSHLTRNSLLQPAAAAPSTPHNAFEIEVQGLRFRVAKQGSKLVKLPGCHEPTPKTVVVGGVRFYRSKSGNLYRGGVVKAQRKSGVVKKVNEPCRIFSSTGSCPKGPSCRYQHDPSRVAICKDFLLKSQCPHGVSCDLSHEVTPERMPLCLHHAKGNCTNPSCIYTHSSVPPSAAVCRAFGLYGYCDKGMRCAERHVFECPDFSNTGRCNIKGCKLLHRERASVLRKAAAEAAAAASTKAKDQDEAMQEEDDERDGDILSDDESVDSNDVDSDEVEEFLNDDDDDDNNARSAIDFGEQKDFIAF